MLDSFIRPYIDPPLNILAKAMVDAGATANFVTIFGFVMGCFAFVALSFQSYGFALAFILLSRALDGLDGAVARQSDQGATDFGGYLDIVCDFIFYAGVVFFFALGQPEYALAAAFLIFSFMGTASSFLTYSILAAQKNMKHDKQGSKTFYYAAGLCEGTETIIFFVLFCLFPAYFVPLAVIFGSLCWFTTAGRSAMALKHFS